jgi:hypothetical protein
VMTVAVTMVLVVVCRVAWQSQWNCQQCTRRTRAA